eukprot:21481-Heterococcus_DN1.PRE.2
MIQSVASSTAQCAPVFAIYSFELAGASKQSGSASDKEGAAITKLQQLVLATAAQLYSRLTWSTVVELTCGGESVCGLQADAIDEV